MSLSRGMVSKLVDLKKCFVLRRASCLLVRTDGKQPFLAYWSKGSNPGCQCFHVQCCRSGKCSEKDGPP